MTRSPDRFLEAHPEIARATLTGVAGSSPREVGSSMLIAIGGTHGTIGGGQLEYMVIDAARAMMARGTAAQTLDIPLGPEIGQCCGGRVEVRLAVMGTADRAAALDAAREAEAALPHVYILGAGHVGRALADLFQHMPVRAILIDGRAGELALSGATLETRLSPLPEADIRAAPAGSAFIVLTHDHALDFLLAAEALSRGDAVYVGMIGSTTKRGRFRAWCRKENPEAAPDRLICPIGAQGSDDKRPEIIASFVMAEIMAALTSTSTKTTAKA